MNTIQASFVPLEVSEDNGVTWLQLVCLENYSIPLDTQVTETSTFCGNAVGVGITKHSVSGSAVCEQNPTGSQVTLNKMMQWQQINEKILYRSQYPETGGSIGGNFFFKGSGYVTKVETKWANQDVVKFDFEITGDGLIDINNP
jgi:hypothetical protein